MVEVDSKKLSLKRHEKRSIRENFLRLLSNLKLLLQICALVHPMVFIEGAEYLNVHTQGKKKSTRFQVKWLTPPNQ